MGFNDPWIGLAYILTALVTVFNVVYGLIKKNQLEKEGEED